MNKLIISLSIIFSFHSCQTKVDESAIDKKVEALYKSTLINIKNKSAELCEKKIQAQVDSIQKLRKIANNFNIKVTNLNHNKAYLNKKIPNTEQKPSPSNTITTSTSISIPSIDREENELREIQENLFKTN